MPASLSTLNTKIYRELQARRLGWVSIKFVTPNIGLSIEIIDEQGNLITRTSATKRLLSRLLHCVGQPQRKLSNIKKIGSTIVLYTNSESYIEEFSSCIANLFPHWKTSALKLLPLKVKFSVKTELNNPSKENITTIIKAQNNWIDDNQTRLENIIRHQQTEVTLVLCISHQNREKLFDNDGWVKFLHFTVKCYDHINLIVCENCWSFEHYYNSCNKSPRCRLCCQLHDSQICQTPNLEREYTCASCFPTKVKHSTLSSRCPKLYQKIREECAKHDIKSEWLSLSPSFPLEYATLPL